MAEEEATRLRGALYMYPAGEGLRTFTLVALLYYTVYGQTSRCSNVPLVQVEYVARNDQSRLTRQRCPLPPACAIAAHVATSSTCAPTTIRRVPAISTPIVSTHQHSPLWAQHWTGK